MTELPDFNPVRVPKAGSMVATAVLLLLHVPPVVASLSDETTDAPLKQRLVLPDIAFTAGAAVTVTVL